VVARAPAPTDRGSSVSAGITPLDQLPSTQRSPGARPACVLPSLHESARMPVPGGAGEMRAARRARAHIRRRRSGALQYLRPTANVLAGKAAAVLTGKNQTAKPGRGGRWQSVPSADLFAMEGRILVGGALKKAPGGARGSEHRYWVAAGVGADGAAVAAAGGRRVGLAPPLGASLRSCWRCCGVSSARTFRRARSIAFWRSALS